MSFVDVVLAVLLLVSLLRGRELGFVRQLFSTGGFFGGLLLGILLEPFAVRLAHSPGGRLGAALGATFGLALLWLTVGEYLGASIKQTIRFRERLNYLDNALGAALAAVSVLAMAWLSGPILAALPAPAVQNAVHTSKIITALDRRLPPVPDVIASIGRLVTPNGFPEVFIGDEPALTPASLPAPAQLAAAVRRDRASVVKIEGRGCGGIVEGSGFVVADGLVATNAHVVAGIAQPQVLDRNGNHAATPIWFDPNLDLAILRVSNLAGGPLSLRSDSAGRGTEGGVLGYPGGGPFHAGTAAVLEKFTALGRDIYNQGHTSRDIYAVQATVVPGNSGGPLVDLAGKVVGVIFATSTTNKDTGYALSMHAVLSGIAQAEARNQPASTGSCAE